MKSRKRIFLISLIILVILIWAYNKYTFRQIVTGELIILNPLEMNNRQFQKLSSKLKKVESEGKKLELCNKILQFKDSHNERQFKKMFTDTHDLFRYKASNIFSYINCLESNKDYKNALKALSPLMNDVLNENHPIKEKYFNLAIKVYEEEKVLREITNGLQTIFTDDCSYCYDRYYLFFDTKIGINVEYSESLKEKEFYQNVVKNEEYYRSLSK